MLRPAPLICCLIACAAHSRVAFADVVPAPAKRVPITIVGTNDLHGRVERTAALAGHLTPLRAQRKAEGGGVVLVDGGDMFQGTLESNLEEGRVVVDAYNALGYDAVAIGNHEFDFGPAGDLVTPKSADDDPRGALKARAKQARFPFLAANVIDNATGMPVGWPNVMASMQKSVGGVGVGVIGVTTVDTPRTTIASNFKGLSIAALDESVVREAKKLRENGARVVVVAAHAGGKCAAFEDPTKLESCDAEGEIMKLARALPVGLVDVIVAGHTHQAMAHTVNGIVILESWANGRGFGRVDLGVDVGAQGAGSVVIEKIHAPRRLCGGPDKDDAAIEACQPEGADGQKVVVDKRLLKQLSPSLAKAKRLRARKLGLTLKSDIKRGYDQESALGNLFADLMRAARPDADITLMNGGGIRQDLHQGPLTYGDVFEMMPFDNRFAKAVMTTAELRAVFEKNLSADRKGGILSMSGATATISCTGGRATVQLVDASGSVLADDKMISVVTTDFVAFGGDGGLGVDEARVVVDEGEPVREHLARGFEKMKGQTLTADDPKLYSTAALRMKNATQTTARCAAAATPTAPPTAPPTTPTPQPAKTPPAKTPPTGT